MTSALLPDPAAGQRRVPLEKRAFSLARIGLLVAAAVSLALFSLLYFKLFGAIPRNADNASAYLEGIDLSRGNFLLRGWTLPPNNFVTSDLALYGLIGRITQADPLGLYYCPAILWALVVVVSIAAAVRGLPLRGRFVASAAVVALIGFPISLIGMLSDSPLHVGTISFMLLAFLMHAALSEQALANGVLLPPYVLLLAAGTFGDPMMIVLGALPALMVSLYYCALDAGRRGGHLVVAAATLAGVVGGQLLLSDVQRRGFYSPQLDVGLVQLADIGRNLGWGAHAIVVLFGTDISSQPTWLGQDLARLLRIPFIVLAFGVLGAMAWRMLVPLWRAVATGLPTRPPPDYLDALLALATALNIASFCASRMISDGGSTRYALPGFVFLVVLMARRLAASRLFAAMTGVALLASAAAIATAVLAAPASPALANDDLKRVAAWLDDRGLKDGYSDFWSSNIITVLTKGRVKVRALMGTDPLAPYFWHANQNWYRVSDLRSDRVFVLRRGDGGPDDLSVHAVRARFGETKQTEKVGSYLVDIYDRDDARLGSW